jgi:hypothetical protein
MNNAEIHHSDHRAIIADLQKQLDAANQTIAGLRRVIEEVKRTLLKTASSPLTCDVSLAESGVIGIISSALKIITDAEEGGGI